METAMERSRDDDPRLEFVHGDDRGDIWRVLIPPDLELLLFHCKAGCKRGGHSHTTPEVGVLLTGKMIYHKVIDGKPEALEKRPGDVTRNLPSEPHMAEFLADSWVLDWKYGPDAGVGKWETIDYPPMREQMRRAGELA